MDVVWKKPPGEGYSLESSEQIDESGRMTHRMVGTGMTGHGRIGYRYVGESFPFIAGTFFGIRHFESKFEDKEARASDETPSTASTDDDRIQMKRTFMTRPELALELGLAF
jgi:hypothetical protein